MIHFGTRASVSNVFIEKELKALLYFALPNAINVNVNVSRLVLYLPKGRITGGPDSGSWTPESH